MSLRKSFRKWFSSRRAPIQSRKNRTERGRKAQPRLEHLEDRIQPSANVFFSNNVLTITGDADFTNQNDSITLTQDGAGNLQIFTNGNLFGPSSEPFASVNQINVF